MSDNDLESKRIDALSWELARLHELLKSTAIGDEKVWAMARIEELQVLIFAGGSTIEVVRTTMTTDDTKGGH